MTNVTNRVSQIDIPLSELNVQEARWYDLLGEKEWVAEGDKISVKLQPYDVIWLMPFSECERKAQPHYTGKL
jgi:sucrose phosphorylase